jgi:hypothetical protein
MSKNLLALTAAFSMTIAGVGTMIEAGPVAAKSRHTKNVSKSKASTKSKKSISQGGAQSNGNSTHQTTGNAGDGRNTLSCNSVLSGNQISPSVNLDLGVLAPVINVVASALGGGAATGGGPAVTDPGPQPIVTVPVGPNGSNNNACAANGGSNTNANGTTQANGQTNANSGSNMGDTTASGASGTAADTSAND